MRTRLDEIVEEETDRTRWFAENVTARGRAIAVGRDIAERAFRYGVEQGLGHLRKATDHGLTFAQVLVQPAPAEEKCETCGGAPHSYPPMLDRRSGEDRRKP